MSSLVLVDSGTAYSTSGDIVLFHIIVPIIFKYARPKDTLKVGHPRACVEYSSERRS